jgi:hypothetical protein
MEKLKVVKVPRTKQTKKFHYLQPKAWHQQHDETHGNEHGFDLTQYKLEVVEGCGDVCKMAMK